MTLLVFLFGLAIGSFLNCVIYRLETKETLWGRSHCPHCNHILSWLELIPVVSFLVLAGKCWHCHTKVSWQYLLVEISTALIFLLIFNFSRAGGISFMGQFSIFNQFEILNFVNLLFLFYIASVLIVIFVYDLKHFIIPDVVLFPAITAAFLYRLFENLIIPKFIENWSLSIDNFYLLSNYMLAALLAAGFFLCIFLVSRGAWIGFGDVKLAILMGLMLGFPDVLLALFLAFLLGAAVGVILMLTQSKELKSEIPFAPFLIFGTLVTLLWGNSIIDWYMHLLL